MSGLDRLTNEQVSDFEKEVQECINNLTSRIKKEVNTAIDELYCDVTPYAYGDALTNFRNALMEDIVSNKPRFHDFKHEKLRQKIWESHKTEILEMLNTDLVRENERLRDKLSRYESPESDYMRKFL